MLFNKIKDQVFEDIEKIQKNTEYKGSEWSRLYLKAWDFFNYSKMEYANKDDIIFIRFPIHDSYRKFFDRVEWFYLPPICTLDKVAKAIDMAREQAKYDGMFFAMLGVPQEYVDLYQKDDLSIVDVEEQNEYLYNTIDLVELKGKKYHSKRNHIAVFDKLYKSEFLPYKKEDRGEVEELFFKWEIGKGTSYDKDDEKSEYKAIQKSLDMAFDKDIYAYVLKVDGRIIGFTLGEITPSNVGIIHIEKADINYNGAYTKLMNMFAKEVLKDTKYINRQEDMGVDGIRQSKLSYKPCGYAMKYFLRDF